MNIVSTQAGGGLVAAGNGTSYAAAFVSATAALVRSRFPAMTGADVARRLFATATPAPGGVDSDGYGYGIVNPYAAVADQIAGQTRSALPNYRRSQPEAATLALQAAQQLVDRAGMGVALAARPSQRYSQLAGSAVLAALVIVAIAAALPRGRRKRRRAGMASPVRDDPEDEQPSPPVPLFENA